MSEPPWAAEHDVPLEQDSALAVGSFPQFRDHIPRVMGRGFGNVVVQIGDAIFRYPRSPVGVGFMDEETTDLPALTKAIGLPISAPVLMGEPTSSYPTSNLRFSTHRGYDRLWSRLDARASRATGSPLSPSPTKPALCADSHKWTHQ